MTYRTRILMGMLLLTVALPAHAQTADMARIMERMQEIITEMQALQSEFADLSSSLGATAPTANTPSTTDMPTGSVLGAATSALQEEAVYGNTNATIEKIQTLLATDPLVYAEGITSGFYGPKTQEAIRNLQARFGMDPVGVVGPSTSELLMEYFVAYPSGNYPEDVLSSRPSARVAGAQTSTEPAQTPSVPATNSVSTPIEVIYLQRDDGETVIRVVMKNGDATGLAITSRDEDDIVEAIAEKVGASDAQVRAVLDTDDFSSSRDDDHDGDDVEDMIEDAEEAIWDAEDAIRDSDGDTDEAEELLEEAEEALEDAEEDLDDRDYDDGYEAAKEARDLAEEAEDEAEEAHEEEDERDDAKDAIEDAEDAIDDAEEAIEDAEEDGDDVDEAEALLEEAEEALEDAEDEFADGDYDDAIEDAEEAEALAEAAEDEV